MKAFILLALFIVGAACQSGKIPCPKIEIAKAKKSKAGKNVHWFGPSQPPKEETQEKTQTSRGSTSRYVKNVTVEEWDCPRPGKKKYLPKAVKDNIRENLKKVKSQQNSSEGTTTNQTAPVYN